jgi:hypothetical protein
VGNLLSGLPARLRPFGQLLGSVSALVPTAGPHDGMQDAVPGAAVLGIVTLPGWFAPVGRTETETVHTSLQELLDPRGGEHTAWLIVRERGSDWPSWLTDRLRGAPLVVVVAQEPGEPHGVLRDRVHARAAETGLSNHQVTGVLLCSGEGRCAERQALANVVVEQVANARGGRLISVTPQH